MYTVCVYVELEPGDTLFFHCNVLHRSEANLSEHSRWSLIAAYNLVSNRSYKDEPASHYTPVAMVPDEAISASENTGYCRQC